MYEACYVFTKEGLLIVSIPLKKNVNRLNEKAAIIFGGLSSAINQLMNDIGHQLLSIELKQGKLLFSIKSDIIFVLHGLGEIDERFGKLFLHLIEQQFLEYYETYFQENPKILIRKNDFKEYKPQVISVFSKLKRIARELPLIFEYIPYSLSIEMINELDKFSRKKNFHDVNRVIEFINTINKKNIVNKDLVASLGEYFGYELAKNFHQSSGNIIDAVDVLRLLNQISESSYDPEVNTFSMKNCPIEFPAKLGQKCWFLYGFVLGCFNNPNISLKEIECVHKGDGKCVFKLSSTWE